MTLSFLDAQPRSAWIKRLIVLFLLAIALAGAVPGYLSGRWTWQQVPEISQIQQLKALQQNGLALPGWRTLDQKTVEIGGHKWSVQGIVPNTETDPTPQNIVWLLLRPQTWSKDMPQIDWIDINGVQHWTADSKRSLQFTVQPVQSRQTSSPANSRLNTSPTTVQARFLRGWTQKRTDAVLQWYAWNQGGHSAPSHWFWADQWQQLHKRQRLAWVAVSLQMPIQPLGAIDTVEVKAKALGELVQATLTTTVF